MLQARLAAAASYLTADSAELAEDQGEVSTKPNRKRERACFWLYLANFSPDRPSEQASSRLGLSFFLCFARCTHLFLSISLFPVPRTDICTYYLGTQNIHTDRHLTRSFLVHSSEGGGKKSWIDSRHGYDWKRRRLRCWLDGLFPSSMKVFSQ